MANFNSRRSPWAVLNYEGGPAWRQAPEMELYSAVVCTMMQDAFYETGAARADRIAELAGQVSPELLARLAVYARTRMHLRSVPLYLLALLAQKEGAGSLLADAVYATLRRADEIPELLACYATVNGRAESAKPLRRLSRQLRKGIARAFNRFDAYQFAKYVCADRCVTMRDALFLVHPKAKDAAQQALFDRIAHRTLPLPYTWERELSALGSQKFATPEERNSAVTRKWEELIDSGRLGYMALLRNLRNILRCKGIAQASVQAACARLSDPVQVSGARQLPFRYLSAYREVSEMAESSLAPQVSDALEKAVQATAANIAGFGPETRVLVACDVSGSMCRPLSGSSKVQYIDVGLLLGFTLASRCADVVTGIFGDTWLPVTHDPRRVLRDTLATQERDREVGWSTNGYKVIDWLVEERRPMDKVMIFTDCQLYDSCYGDSSLPASWKRYKEFCPSARLYIFDLSGYGTTPISTREGDVTCVSGWSDAVFEALEAQERGEGVIAEIMATPLAPPEQ